ncbi:F-box only protein 17-like [Heteronotia binoei]|uniref:F-box only protein 17-like n=1 Tax=Heteronotia binoei TaxID=13085 RepID=UPI0029309CE9|nr:F-box only protein 17-like [Heteronotia binoei]
MGQAKSRRRKPPSDTTPPSSQEIQIWMDLTLLPQELLVLILSWVPGPTLVTVGRLVCREWRDLIDGPVLWKLQGERDPSKREAFRAALEAAHHCPRMEWARVGVLQPFGRNLSKSRRKLDLHPPCRLGVLDTSYLEDNPCWISYFIDLVKEGLWEDLLDAFQPDIFISDWWGTHEKCSCTYNLYVLLLAADRSTVISRFDTKMDRAGEWNISFQQPSHVFRKYGPGVRYLRFQHTCKRPEPQHMEAHLTNSSVLVKLSG